MAHNRRRGWQHFEKITGEAIAETVIFQNFTLGADYERHNWKHYLARICFMSYGIPTFVSSLEMIENFGIHWEGSSRLFDLCGGPSVGLEIFGKKWNFCFFLEMLMILKISRFWKIIISKEEGQLWRWEGYIGGNCNVSHFREGWFLRKMQCISGQNYCVLLEKFLVQIAMQRWPGSGGFGPFSASGSSTCSCYCCFDLFKYFYWFSNPTSLNLIQPLVSLTTPKKMADYILQAIKTMR